MQSSAKLPTAHPHLSQLCELLEFSPLLQWEWELASVSDLTKDQGVWLQSAEHHSTQSAFIFWIIYFWFCWSSTNQVYLLNLKGKKKAVFYTQHGFKASNTCITPSVCTRRSSWGWKPPPRSPCASPAQAGSPRPPPGTGTPQPPWSLLQQATTFTTGENVSLRLGGISCVYACARSVLSDLWAPLGWAWLFLLCSRYLNAKKPQPRLVRATQPQHLGSPPAIPHPPWGPWPENPLFLPQHFIYSTAERWKSQGNS